MQFFDKLFQYFSQTLLLLGEGYHHYYSKFEQHILEGETNQRFRIKKSILLSHSYLIILFYILNPLFNRKAKLITSILHILSALCQIRILQGKNYKLIGSYVYIHAIASMLLQYYVEGQALTIIGLVLANQHMFFLFAEDNILNKIYVPFVLVVMRYVQGQLIEDINEMNIDKIEDNISSLYTSWPLIFLFHHYGAQILTRSYRVALIDNMSIQCELQNTLKLLEKRNYELKDALQARELFIASVSHELRNPLNSLIGNIELLRLDIKNEKWLKALDICKICSELLLGQINNILDVAKINAEKLELHYLPENIHRIIERVWNISIIPIKQKKIDGEVFVSGDMPKYVLFDSHRMNQILLNLIGNATKFAANGSVKVRFHWHQNEKMEALRTPSKDFVDLLEAKQLKGTQVVSCPELSAKDEPDKYTNIHSPENIDGDNLEILSLVTRTRKPRLMTNILVPDFIHASTDNVSIEAKASRRNLYPPRQKGILKIEVTDSGCGMSPQALKNLFQPFKQADATIARKFGGTGLGLYITKQIIQKMGGEIHAYSKENVGACFCVLLPVETTEPKQDDKAEEETQRSKSPERNINKEVKALVVDDMITNQVVLTSYLKKLHIESETANNGQEALNVLRAKGPGYFKFITMDLQMPVMDGLTACKEIRKLERQWTEQKDIPIVIVTGNCMEVEKTRCLDPRGEIKAQNFFRKPLTFDECKGAVQNVLNEMPEPLRRPSLRKFKVLIVDDDSFNIKITQDYLENYGISCVTCSSGKEAIQAVKIEKFNLVLMDCEMPEMDGYETTKGIRLIRPETVIIGITGHRREECLNKCLDSGMVDMETKPIDFNKLVDMIRKMAQD